MSAQAARCFGMSRVPISSMQHVLPLTGAHWEPPHVLQPSQFQGMTAAIRSSVDAHA